MSGVFEIYATVETEGNLQLLFHLRQQLLSRTALPLAQGLPLTLSSPPRAQTGLQSSFRGEQVAQPRIPVYPPRVINLM